jgi:hypothetical protein
MLHTSICANLGEKIEVGVKPPNLWEKFEFNCLGVVKEMT